VDAYPEHIWDAASRMICFTYSKLTLTNSDPRAYYQADERVFIGLRIDSMLFVLYAFIGALLKDRIPFYIVPSNALRNSLQDVLNARDDEKLQRKRSADLEDELRTMSRHHSKAADIKPVTDSEGRVWKISSRDLNLNK
jgi:hypothetical protein